MTQPQVCIIYAIVIYIFDVLMMTMLVLAVSGCEHRDYGCVKEMLPPNGLKPCIAMCIRNSDLLQMFVPSFVCAVYY